MIAAHEVAKLVTVHTRKQLFWRMKFIQSVKKLSWTWYYSTSEVDQNLVSSFRRMLLWTEMFLTIGDMQMFYKK